MDILMNKEIHWNIIKPLFRKIVENTYVMFYVPDTLYLLTKSKPYKNFQRLVWLLLPF